MDIFKTLLSKLLSCVCFGPADDDNEAGPRILEIGDPTDFSHEGTHEGGALKPSIVGAPPPFVPPQQK